VAQVGKLADGAIVGSALLNHIEHAPPDQIVSDGVAFVRGLRG
jgi:tryptophan synthase alpha subunit